MNHEKTFRVTVGREWEGRRADEVLRAVFGLSGRQIRALKRTKGFFLDGQPVYANALVHEGQQLCAVCEDLYDQGIVPEEGPLSVLYQDDDLLVLDKPAPMATLPEPERPDGTLANRVAAFEGGQGKFIFRPVNRLDRGTSGILVAARHAPAQQRLMELLHTDAFVREYIALCEGLLPSDEGVIDAPIARLPGDSVRRCVSPEGKPSRTVYRVLRRLSKTNRTLLLLRLETGRTHQIRVHLQSIGHPVVGDALYGCQDVRLPGRFALHAARLSLIQPFTGARIRLCAPLPPELRALITEEG